MSSSSSEKHRSCCCAVLKFAFGPSNDKSANRLLHLGLLLLRIGLGIMFIRHGWPKISGGTETWTFVGRMVLGDDVSAGLAAPMGLLAALSEFGGGILLVFGLLFRPATLFLFFTMAGAVTYHLKKGDTFQGYSHALEAGIVFVALMVSGPGRYALDTLVRRFVDKWHKPGKTEEDIQDTQAPGS